MTVPLGQGSYRGMTAECSNWQTRCMQIGDNVRVRSTGRRARIIEDLGESHFRVLYYAEPDADALDRDPPQDEDDAGGVYTVDDLEVIA